MSRLKSPAVWLAVAASTLFLGHVGAKASGFCYSQTRILTDQELINAATAWQLRGVANAEANQAVRAIAAGPNCCRVLRAYHPFDGPVERALRIVTGTTVSTVSIDFNPRNLSAADEEFIGDAAEITVSNCGEAADLD